MLRLSWLLACSVAGLSTLSAAEEAPPPPKPATDAIAAEVKERRKSTLAGRYAATMLDGGLVDELIEEAFDGEEDELDGDHLIGAALQPDTSDLPAIRERGFVRLAIAPDPLLIAFDGERAIGVAMELAQELEKYMKARRGDEGTPTVVVPMPTPRGQIPERLAEGMTDFTALTITDQREERFDFSQPLLTDVNDIVVLGPEAPPVKTVDDLVGVPIYVQEGSRYSANLKEINAVRTDEGLEPLTVKYVDERLDDYDLMEMAEIGLIPATVMSSFKADFWSQIYTSVDVRQDLELTRDGRIAWAVRTNNPKLLELLNGFAGKVKKGTLIGNVLLKRYFDSTEWIENIDREDVRRRIDEVEPVIRKYSEQFDFEPELVLAQAYQESKLDQSKRSHVGAIGVMQVMPRTAADPVVGIPDVSGLDNNVHAGIKYLRWLRDTYFSDAEIAPLDQTLLAFAAYNAGPGGVARSRKRAAKMGLDPNVWFENVEVAIARAVSREPAVYVRNIFKYYVSYRLLRELEAERQVAVETVAEIEEQVEDLSLEEKIEVLEETEIVIDENEAESQVGMGAEPGDAAPALGADDASDGSAAKAGTGSDDDEADAEAAPAGDETEEQRAGDDAPAAEEPAS